MSKSSDIYPHILIGAPQSDKKNYCFDEWLQNVRNFTYPKDKLEIFLADNSDTPDNYRKLLKQGIKAVYISRGKRGILERITESHNAVRKYCLDNNFSFLFHLETDIFPSEDIIERLLFHRKYIVSAPYHINHGAKRDMCVLGMDDSPYVKESYMISEYDPFYNGELQPCFSAGLGCVLIHKSILHDITFRFRQGLNAHPDTYFAEDCMLKDNAGNENFKFYVDTSLFVMHKNVTKWGKFGIDFK